MFIPVFLIACGNKQADPEAPVDEPAEVPADEIAPEADPAADAPADGAEAPTDCAEGTAIYQHRSAPLRAPTDDMAWIFTVHDTGYWSVTARAGEQAGCLSADELASFQGSLAEADIAAPELEPGMARCMAMPTSTHTVTVGEKTATWQGPCGSNNPSESLNALIDSVAAVSHGRE